MFFYTSVNTRVHFNSWVHLSSFLMLTHPFFRGKIFTSNLHYENLLVPKMCIILVIDRQTKHLHLQFRNLILMMIYFLFVRHVSVITRIFKHLLYEVHKNDGGYIIILSPICLPAFTGVGETAKQSTLFWPGLVLLQWHSYC